MACCVACFEAVGLKQSKAAKRKEVQARIAVIQKELDATEDDLHAKKEHREELKRQVEIAKSRVESLQKENAGSSRGGAFSWLTGLFSGQPSFAEQHINKLQQDVAASREALQQMEAQRIELESKVELAEATQLLPMGNGEKAASSQTADLSRQSTPVFGQVRSVLREKTPMDMREQEETLHKQLQSIKEEIREEEQLREEAHHEKMHHETTAMAIEVEKRSKSWKEQLGPKKQFSFSFRGEDPSQKEIKEKLNATAQELQAAEAKAADECRTHGELLRKLSRSQKTSSDSLCYSSSDNSNFTFGALSQSEPPP